MAPVADLAVGAAVEVAWDRVARAPAEWDRVAVLLAQAFQVALREKLEDHLAKVKKAVHAKKGDQPKGDRVKVVRLKANKLKMVPVEAKVLVVKVLVVPSDLVLEAPDLADLVALVAAVLTSIHSLD